MTESFSFPRVHKKITAPASITPTGIRNKTLFFGCFFKINPSYGKYPFYDIVLFIAILSNVLFMSIAIIIIRTKKTSRKNSQILHKVMQLPVDEEKERSYTILEEME